MSRFFKLEADRLRPLSSVPDNELPGNGPFNLDGSQNYSRIPAVQGLTPYPLTIGWVQGLLPDMSTWVMENMQAKIPQGFYFGGNSIDIVGGMSFGPGINGLKKVAG